MSPIVKFALDLAAFIFLAVVFLYALDFANRVFSLGLLG